MRTEVLAEPTSTELQIDEDLATQCRIWRFERWGWAALALLALASMAGVFGDGWLLAHTQRQDDAGELTVRFEPRIRDNRPTTLELQTSPTERAEVLWIHLSNDYFRRMRIDRIMPEPKHTVIGANGIRLGFDPSPVGERGFILVTLTPIRFGLLRGTVALAGGSQVAVTQVAFP